MAPVPCQIASGPSVEQRNELDVLRRLDLVPFVADSVSTYKSERKKTAKDDGNETQGLVNTIRRESDIFRRREREREQLGIEMDSRRHRRKGIARAKIFDSFPNVKGVQGVGLVVETKVHAIHQSAAVLDRLRQKSMEDMTHHNAGAI